jgi:DnaK suppressor protein
MANQNDKKSEIDADRARELLVRERERVEAALADLGRERVSQLAEIDNEQSSDDDAETIVEEEVDDAVARSLRQELEQIARAEQRLEDGSYGLSVDSGDPIPAGRLERVPYAERTIEEQQHHEKRNGGR